MLFFYGYYPKTSNIVDLSKYQVLDHQKIPQVTLSLAVMRTVFTSTKFGDKFSHKNNAITILSVQYKLTKTCCDIFSWHTNNEKKLRKSAFGYLTTMIFMIFYFAKFYC